MYSKYPKLILIFSHIPVMLSLNLHLVLICRSILPLSIAGFTMVLAEKPFLNYGIFL